MSTLTPNYNLIKPGVNDPTDQDLWGGYLNTDMDIIDTTIKSISDRATLPVGSLYFNASVATNPATLLGYGTWTAFGEGRMMLGAGSGSGLTPRVAGATGGAETKSIAQANLPNISLSFDTQTNTASNGGTVVYKANGPVDGTQSVSLGGSGTALDIMNPFIVVYIWQRTA